MIRQMMRTEASLRIDIHAVCHHPVVNRAWGIMESIRDNAKQDGTSLFAASPLGRTRAGFLDEILGRTKAMNMIM